MLWESVDVGGVMVIIEPGNPYGSHTVRTARQFVLDTFGQGAGGVGTGMGVGMGGGSGGGVGVGERAGRTKGADERPPRVQFMLPPPTGYAHADVSAAVVAPCTHDNACPLAAGVWCSFRCVCV